MGLGGIDNKVAQMDCFVVPRRIDLKIEGLESVSPRAIARVFRGSNKTKAGKNAPGTPNGMWGSVTPFC